MHKRTSRDGERESRSNHLTHLLEECRMVLPGIQATLPRHGNTIAIVVNVAVDAGDCL